MIQTNASLMCICVHELMSNCSWTMKQATELNLMLLFNSKLKQANYKKNVIIIIYIQSNE